MFRYKTDKRKLYTCILLFVLLFKMTIAVSSSVVLEELKKFYVNEKTVVNFSGNKANVSIQGWDKDSIKVYLQIVLSHKDKKVAEKEANYVIWNINKRGTTIFINNNFSLPTSTNKINSLITVTYQIFLPNETSLILNNKYGDLNINDFYGHVNLNNSYGNINLTNLSGYIRIYSNLCNIYGTLLDGNYEFETKNTDYTIKNISGDISLKNKVGKIYVEPGNKLRNLSINSLHSEVQINANNILDYNYDLNTKYAEVKVPDKYQKLVGLNSEGKLKYVTNESKPLIKVITSFNNIKIN